MGELLGRKILISHSETPVNVELFIEQLTQAFLKREKEESKILKERMNEDAIQSQND